MNSGAHIAVIGGGIIGLSAAWRLAQAGAAVTVFEAGRIGNEASWAGAGMLAPGGEFEERTVWSDLALDSLQLYPEFVNELEAESGVMIDFRKCGAFDVAFDAAEGERLRRRADLQNSFGIYSEQFPASRVPGLRSGAIACQYYPNDAVVNPRDVVRALVLACKKAEVDLREFEPKRSILSGCEYDRFVIAAGAWSSEIQISHAGEPLPIPKSFPVRGHLVAFEEETGVCDPIVRSGHTYLLRRTGNAVIAGSSTEDAGFDRRIDGQRAADIAKNAADIVPLLRGKSYTAWNGLRPGSASGNPVLGRVGTSSIWLAYGHYRNGILLAPATARLLAREILGGDSVAAGFKQASLQKDLPLPAGHPR